MPEEPLKHKGGRLHDSMAHQLGLAAQHHRLYVGTIDDRVTALVDLAASGHPGAVAVLDRFAQRLARATAVVCNLLDVDRVVLGGPAWDRIGGQVFARVAALLDELRAARGVHRVEVEDSLLGGGSGAVGAACLVLDAVHTPRTSSLILQ